MKGSLNIIAHFSMKIILVEPNLAHTFFGNNFFVPISFSFCSYFVPVLLFCKLCENKIVFRSSHLQVFYKIDIFKHSAKFTSSLFLNKVASLRPFALLKQRL